ncbi:MAG: NfeD family protein [Desulfoplanes sp.]|nr:NfeD family protein [Desulfoplanes sp.]MDD4649064.1 NfeD family protein [Desulfoplanes sp.]
MYPSPALIWFFVGVIFLIGEMTMPAFILIFFTAGSWIAGLCAWLLGVSIKVQIIIFVCSSLLFLLSLRKYGLRTFKGTVRSDIDDAYADSKIGKKALVTTTIVPGREGEIKVQGSFWRAVADTKIAEGESVIIETQTSDDGLTLKVKPVDGRGA